MVQYILSVQVVRFHSFGPCRRVLCFEANWFDLVWMGREASVLAWEGYICSCLGALVSVTYLLIGRSC